jgi:hypothetical protein
MKQDEIILDQSALDKAGEILHKKFGGSGEYKGNTRSRYKRRAEAAIRTYLKETL